VVWGALCFVGDFFWVGFYSFRWVQECIITRKAYVHAIDIPCLIASKSPSRPNASPPIAHPRRRTRGPSRRSTSTRLPLHDMTKPPILRAHTGSKQSSDKAWGNDVILATAKRRPDPREEVVQVRSEQARKLCGRRVRAVDDEGHEEQGKGQEFGVEVDDEEVDLARGVVLGEGVGVGEGEGGEEGVAV